MALIRLVHYPTVSYEVLRKPFACIHFILYLQPISPGSNTDTRKKSHVDPCALVGERLTHLHLDACSFDREHCVHNVYGTHKVELSTLRRICAVICMCA